MGRGRVEGPRQAEMDHWTIRSLGASEEVEACFASAVVAVSVSVSISAAVGAFGSEEEAAATTGKGMVDLEKLECKKGRIKRVKVNPGTRGGLASLEKKAADFHGRRRRSSGSDAPSADADSDAHANSSQGLGTPWRRRMAYSAPRPLPE